MNAEKKSKRQMRREQVQKKEQRGKIFTVVLITLGAAFVLYAILAPTLRPIAEVVAAETHERYMADDNSMGDPAALIQIVEYSDFQCPFCDRHYTETEPLLEQYYVDTGLIHFTYKTAGNFVSRNSGNTESQDAAAAAYCAGDQDKFWQMHDALFANNRDVENQGSFTNKRLKAIAETVGLDMNEFNDCLDDGKYKSRVQDDLVEGESLGLQGTPFFVVTYIVNGETKTKTIDGAQPFSEFQVTLEAIRNEIGAQ
ncbi:MAG: thioredoxin domain-containing protein [Anaerolineales bacterium]|nr:thioredoxin domain-containing protein [Anaerolineales bacterium]